MAILWLLPQPEDILNSVVLDRYKIVTKIAEGGNGQIFLARQEGAAGFARPVVVKQILPWLLRNQTVVELFAREARILSKLRHPNVVSVLDFAKHEDTYLMVLDYVHGYHLGRWRAFYKRTEREFPPGRAVAVALQILDALAYVHVAKGMDGKPLNIIHRDIKPSNVLISTEGVVKIVDFGIARMETDATDISGSRNEVRGTFAYVAPEIFLGEPPSEQTDVYSTAVVLHELLIGHNEFRDKDQRAIIRRVLEHEPTAPDGARIDISTALSDIAIKALNKDPSLRYPSAREFAQALRALEEIDEAVAKKELADAAGQDFRDVKFAAILGLTSLSDFEEAIASGTPIPDAARSRQSSKKTESSPDAAPTMPTADVPFPRQFESAPARGPRLWLVAGLVASVAMAAIAIAISVASRGGGDSSGPARVVVVQSERRVADAASRRSADDAGSAADAAVQKTPPVPADAAAAEPKPVEPRKPAKPSTAAELSRAFRAKNAKLRACFTKHAKEVSGTPRVSVRFKVNAAGKVKSAEVIPGSVGATALGRCLHRVAKTTRFGRQGRERTFRIPVTVRTKN